MVSRGFLTPPGPCHAQAGLADFPKVCSAFRRWVWQNSNIRQPWSFHFLLSLGFDRVLPFAPIHGGAGPVPALVSMATAKPVLLGTDRAALDAAFQ